MALIKKLTKVGNSVGVILPAEVLQIAGMDADSEVEMAAEEGKVVLKTTRLKDHKVMKTFMSVVRDYDETLKKLAK